MFMLPKKGGVMLGIGILPVTMAATNSLLRNGWLGCARPDRQDACPT